VKEFLKNLASRGSYVGVNVEWTPHAVPTAHFYDENNVEVRAISMKNLKNQKEIEEFFIYYGFPLKRKGEMYDDMKAHILQWGGHVYEIHPEVNFLSFAQDYVSSRTLNGQKGYLATISSAEEQQFVDSVLKTYDIPSVWLGGSDEEKESYWKWGNDGQIFSSPSKEQVSLLFTNWAKGEPNNGNGNEDCLTHSHQKGWNDVNCLFETSSLLIEYESGPTKQEGKRGGGGGDEL